LEKLAAVLNRSKEVIGKAAGAVEEVLSAVTDLEAVENSFGHTASPMKEDREVRFSSFRKYLNRQLNRYQFQE
jgi:hypothetical protein